MLGLGFKISGVDLDRKIIQSAHIWSFPIVFRNTRLA